MQKEGVDCKYNPSKSNLYVERENSEGVCGISFLKVRASSFGRRLFRQKSGRTALVRKSGQYSIGYRGLGGKRKQFLKDLYITLIDLKWRWAVVVFFVAFFASFFMFTIGWWLVCLAHDDFNHLNEPGWQPCVKGMSGYAGLLLFSIETQTTIGYGFVHPNTECPGALFMLYLQASAGLIIETVLLTFLFSKMARPKQRSKTVLFSNKACVCQENGQLCLQIRVGDIREKSLIGGKVHGILVRERLTQEGVMYPLYQYELSFEAYDMEDDLCLMWPVVLSHRITESSPLWNIRDEDMQNESFEIIIFLEGTVEATGELCQARTSYTQEEILWGHRFERVEEFDASRRRWCIDFGKFHNMTNCPTPRLSARDMSIVYRGSGVLKNFQFNGHFPLGISRRTQQLLDSMLRANCKAVPNSTDSVCTIDTEGSGERHSFERRKCYGDNAPVTPYDIWREYLPC